VHVLADNLTSSNTLITLSSCTQQQLMYVQPGHSATGPPPLMHNSARTLRTFPVRPAPVAPWCCPSRHTSRNASTQLHCSSTTQHSGTPWWLGLIPNYYLALHTVLISYLQAMATYQQYYMSTCNSEEDSEMAKPDKFTGQINRSCAPS